MAWRYIAIGFRTDCFKLLSAFQESECHSYKRFTEIWREMKFSYIYYERKSFCELLEFTEEVFMVCKEFLHPPNSLPFQIGSIYLLYGLYLKQPTRNHVKIRLTLSEWKLLNKVWDITLSVNDLAVPLIISRLYLMNAFHFCFTERQMGLEKKFRKYYEGGEKSMGEMLPMTPTPIMEQLDIQALENVCAVFYQYEEARNNLNRLLSDVKIKKHFSSDIMSKLKTSALERIEKENREINRYSELNCPTDSEDSVEEINEDAETGVPWWKCKKKMPWWKRCLPFGRKQTEKTKKRGKENSVDDSSELSLEEDVDNPDIIYFPEKASMHSEEHNSTKSRNVTTDVPLLPCEGKTAHLLSPNNIRKKRKGKQKTITTNTVSDKSSLPSGGNITFGIPSYSSCPVNRRRKSKWEQQTITTNNISGKASLPTGGAVSFNTPSSSSCPVNRGRKRKWKQQTITTNNISDNTSLPTGDNISFDVPSNSSCPVNRRRKTKWEQQTITTNSVFDKASLSTGGTFSFDIPNSSPCPVNRGRKRKWKQQTITTNSISDNTSLSTGGNTSVDIPSFSSCPVNRRRKSKWEQQTITTNSVSDNASLPIGGTVSLDISSSASIPANRGRKRKWKQQTITTNSISDNTSLPRGGNISVDIPSYSSCPVNRRRKSKWEQQTITTNSVSDKTSLSFPSTASFPVNRGRKRKWKQQTITTNNISDNTSLPTGDNISFDIPSYSSCQVNRRKGIQRIAAVADNTSVSPEENKSVATTPGNKRKTSNSKNMWAIRRYWKGKKPSTVSAITTDNSLIPLVGDKNFGASTHPTASASKRRKITGKDSAETMNVITNGSSVFRDSLSVFLPGQSSSHREAKKKITEKDSAGTMNVITNSSSVFRDSLSVFLPAWSLSHRETKK